MRLALRDSPLRRVYVAWQIGALRSQDSTGAPLLPDVWRAQMAHHLRRLTTLGAPDVAGLAAQPIVEREGRDAER